MSRKKFCRTEEYRKKRVFERYCKRCGKLYTTVFRTSTICVKCYFPCALRTMKGREVKE